MKPLKNPLVVHCEREEFDVYIGRPGPWGNPFRIGIAQNRTQVIAKHREWFLSQPELIERAKKELRGKRLGCWCSPKACHGDILAEIANE